MHQEQGTTVAFSYNYNWTSSPNPIPASIGNNGDKINNGPGPDRDDELGLQEGAYTLQVTSAVTGCKVSASTNIIKNVTPIFITASTVVPKYYCDPSGNILITQVQYTDRAGVTQIPVTTDFTYAWTQPSGVAVPAVNTANLDSVNFAAITGGVYQVVATRTVGAPGRLFFSPCKHRDQRQDPKARSDADTIQQHILYGGL